MSTELEPSSRPTHAWLRAGGWSGVGGGRAGRGEEEGKSTGDDGGGQLLFKINHQKFDL